MAEGDSDIEGDKTLIEISPATANDLPLSPKVCEDSAFREDVPVEIKVRYGVAHIKIPKEVFEDAVPLVENAQMRARVLKRRYWYIADVPLAVCVWNPETAQSPLDLTAMPLWVDFKGVPRHLYSQKGLSFLSLAAGKFECNMVLTVKILKRSQDVLEQGEGVVEVVEKAAVTEKEAVLDLI
ncbi:hypothetical protein YC2023_024106 [Brassica napus]